MAEDNRPIPFASIDAAWLRMDQSTNLMMIVGVLMFDQPVDFRRLQDLIQQRLVDPFPRFRQRVCYPQGRTGQPHWETDPHFDLRTHLRRLALPAPGDEETLQAMVSDFMSTPLDPTKPLWQFHLIENYGGGCALLARLHHCIADGIALVRVLLSITDETPDEASPPPTRHNGRVALDGLVKPVAQVVAGATRATNTLLAEGLDLWRDPLRAVDLLQSGANSAAAAVRLLALPADPPTPLKGTLGVTKQAIWSEPFDLNAVKKIGKITASTVNDILLSCVAGALRRYLLQRNFPLDGLTIRAAVPINMRAPEAPIELGNRFSLIFLGLPVGVQGVLDRLLAIKDNMDVIKGSAEALVAYGILNAIGSAPEQIEQAVVGMFGSKATGVMTNVPGPRQTIYMAGRPVRDIMFWVPQSGYLGLGVSILSYAGKVRIGLAVDAGLIPDPEQIIADFHDEFDELVQMMRQAEAIKARVQSAE